MSLLGLGASESFGAPQDTNCKSSSSLSNQTVVKIRSVLLQKLRVRRKYTVALILFFDGVVEQRAEHVLFDHSREHSPVRTLSMNGFAFLLFLFISFIL